MRLLTDASGAEELLVERVKAQRFAEARGEYDAFYARFNDTLVRIRTGR